MSPPMQPTVSADLPSTLLIPLLSGAGAADAWRVFLGRYWPRLVAWACRHVSYHDAEHIASDVLDKLGCGCALASFDRSRGCFSSWIRVVLRRAVLVFQRNLQQTPGRVGQGTGGTDPSHTLLVPATLDQLSAHPS